MKVITKLGWWVCLLVMLTPLAHGDTNHPELFGYKIGQRYKVTRFTERRMYGVIVANPAGLTDELEELLLTVTPKTHTIVSIKGTVRTGDRKLINRIKSQYWKLWKTQCVGWTHFRSPTDSVSFYKSPYALKIRTSRTRTQGVLELSVSLEHTSGSPERSALEALRIEEAGQIIAEHQSGGS